MVPHEKMLTYSITAQKGHNTKNWTGSPFYPVNNENETHPDLIGARVLVQLEDRVIIIVLGGAAVVVGAFPLRSRFAGTHDN